MSTGSAELAEASDSQPEPEPVRASQGQLDRQIARQEPVSEQTGRPDKNAGSRRSLRADSSFSSQQQLAAGGTQPAADSRVVPCGVALLYESPGGNQVDGLPVPTAIFTVPEAYAARKLDLESVCSHSRVKILLGPRGRRSSLRAFLLLAALLGAG